MSSNCSMLEAIDLCESISGNKLNYEYIDRPRKGDHIWYVSDITKFKKDYPKWEMQNDIESILIDIYKNI